MVRLVTRRANAAGCGINRFLRSHQQLKGEMKTIGCHICLFLLSVALSIPGGGAAGAADAGVKRITACGTERITDNNTAAARRRSLQNAQRNAVEMGVGTFIGSQTIIEKDKLLKDQIYSRASGYITRWQPISENIMPEENTYRVCIEAFVKTGHIKKDLEGLAVPVMLQLAGNPHFLAVYLQETDAAPPPDAAIVNAAEKALQAIFVDNHFKMLKNTPAEQTRELINRIGIHDILAGASSSSVRADMLIVYSVSVQEKKWLKSKHFVEFRLDVNLQAVDTTNARIIASIPKTCTVRMLKTETADYYNNSQLINKTSQMAATAAKETAKEALNHFNDRFLNGTPYYCTFKDFDPLETSILTDIIENLNGFRNKTVRHRYTNSTVVEIVFAGKSYDFHRQLNAALQKKGIPVKVPPSTGNTFIIKKR